MQKQIASLRNQAESAKVVQEIKVSKDKGKVGTSANPGNSKITKKQTKGCCGTDSKCNIM